MPYLATPNRDTTISTYTPSKAHSPTNWRTHLRCVDSTKYWGTCAIVFDPITFQLPETVASLTDRREERRSTFYTMTCELTRRVVVWVTKLTLFPPTDATTPAVAVVGTRNDMGSRSTCSLPTWAVVVCCASAIAITEVYIEVCR